MHTFLDNDIFLGNLFIQLLEKKITHIEFKKIYDCIFYFSENANKERRDDKNTVVLVNRERLEYFFDKYREFIIVEEDVKSIRVIEGKEKEALDCFTFRYAPYFTDFTTYLIDAVTEAIR